MKKIGGNVTGQLQVKSGYEKNEIGERVPKWEPSAELFGFLDYSSGEAQRANYDAKVEESTHVFVCDYMPLESSVSAENARLIVDDKRFDVVLIDDPMGLHRHLELYLKYTGAQNG